MTGPESVLPDLVAPDELVTATRGTLPIIISAPHGGTQRVPGAARREADGRYAHVTVRDVNTDRLAGLVAERLAERLGGRPSVVIARFSRKDADANRQAGDAYDPAPGNPARRVYEAYHRALRTLVTEAATAHNGRALLIDLHGQSRDRAAIFRGTRDGLTCSRVLAREGPAAIVGPRGVFGVLRAKGYTVLPSWPDAPAGAEPAGAHPAPNSDELRAIIGDEAALDGGYIVATYGSHHAEGVDAIQVELGAQRDDAAMDKTARDLADAIAAFATRYLGVPEPR